MRAHYAFLAALLAGKIAAHPLCYIDDKPTDYDEVLEFCPEPQAGACCTDLEEAEVVARYDAVSTVPLTGNCAGLYLEVVCGVCHSYSGHLYEVLGAELGVLDGMTMKSSFCEELVSECSGQINFPTYDDGMDYCTKHTGGGDDLFWSYPYDEPEIFEPGLTDVFSLSDDDKPAQTISVKQSPDSSMYWLVGQAGEIKSVPADNLATSETIIDISGALPDGGDFYLEYEEGLLDVAFGPMFGISGNPNYFYLSYTCQLDDGLGARNRLSKFEYFAGDATATRNSEEILLTTVPKSTNIHSAGWCGFQPSAYGNSGSQDLYWTTGDGGPQTDPDNNGQNTDNLLASVIRISVPSDGTGYTIPAGNIDNEICASGFRNPWRCSFDRETDELYCGDVGHTNVEEIDIVECGNNYGWSRFEGSRCQEAVEDNENNPPCDGSSRAGFTFPWFEYCHPDYDSSLDSEQPYTNGVDICGERFLVGHSVIGGFVYRGTYFADLLEGAYIFGDNTNKNVYFIMEEADGTLTSGSIISDGSLQIINFAEDNNGELMFIDQSYDIYHMPCGDLCATTCLDQVENQPTYTSEGCFADDVNDRAFATMAPDCGDGETAMSPAICASYCATVDGAIYSAVQYGYECFCGGAEASSGDQYYGRHGASDQCNVLCTANPEEICGGSSAMEVFLLGEPEATEPPEDTPLLEVDPEPVTTTDTLTDTTVDTTTDSTTDTLTDTTVDTTTDTVVPTADPSSLGCFSDPAGARMFLEADSTSSALMTADFCATLCADYPYYGTQYSIECWCGSNDDYAANGEGVCDFTCGGDPSEICGGYYSMSVYENAGVVVLDTTTDVGTATDEPTDVTEPTDATDLGCWNDPRDGDRVMPELMATTDDMTTEACAALCAGYVYFGTQYGTECWCGDASINYELHGEAECDFPCAGDASDICGGFDMISVYEAA